MSSTLTHTALLTLALSSLAASGCSKSGADATASSASPTASSAAPAKSESKSGATMGGQLDVQVDKKHAAKIDVGAAFVDLYPVYADGATDESGKPAKPTGYKFALRIFNDGVKGATCDTKLDDDKAVGGTNWALNFDTMNSDHWDIGSANPLPLSPGFFYVDDTGPHGMAPWSPVTLSKNEVFVDAFSLQSVTFRFSLENTIAGDRGPGWIRGKVVAKVCSVDN